MEVQRTNKTFDQNDFISLLLPKLYQKGVLKINAEELSRKLYCYFTNPKFQELFLDIVKDRISDKVDIAEAMSKEIYFYKTVRKISTNSEILQLRFGENYDVSYYENMLSENGLLLMETIVQDLANRYVIESSSRHYMEIYGVNPNNEYLVIKRSNGWKLITDGDIKHIESISGSNNRNISIENPSNPSSSLSFCNGTAQRVELENASYAIMQGLHDDKIKRLKIYTNLTDLESLRKISEVANEEYETQEEVQVKKLILR